MLLFLVLAHDFADRTLISSLGPTLKHVYHLNNSELGLVAAAFAVVGAIASVPIGMLTDRINRTLLFAVTLLLWAFAEGLTGAAISLAMLVGARIFLGVVSATSGPTTPSLVGDLVPAGNRGRTFGFINSGQLIGLGVGFLLPVAVLSFASFRWNFWILAVCSLVLAFAFWRLREPERTGAGGPSQQNQPGTQRGWRRRKRPEQNLTQAQRIVRDEGIVPSRNAMVTRDPGEMSLWDAVRYVFNVRTDLIVMIARAIGDFFFQGIGTFAVVFATSWYGISQSKADLYILVLGIGALIGVLLVGRVSDALLRRQRLNSRLWLGAFGYILAPLVLYPAFLTHSLLLALPFFAAGAFLLVGAGPPLDAVRIDVLVPRLRGRAEAIRQVLRTIAEGGAPFLIGLLADNIAGGGTAGLDLTFLVLLPLLVIAGLILLLALRTYQPDVAAAYASTKTQDQAQEGSRHEKHTTS